jgi:hypothetical protein
VKDYKLSYPIYLDLDESGTQNGAIERANIFGDIIEKAGYWCGVYANLNWWENYLVGLERFTKWVAQYNKTCDYKGAHLDIWQYSSKGKVDGIGGNVDMNECYRNFPVEILGAPKKTVHELALEVLDDKWGIGAERKAKLEAAGYDYNAVQAEVNRIWAAREDAVLDKVAKAVIRGNYGDDPERSKRLKAEGYDPKKVQDRVNELMK